MGNLQTALAIESEDPRSRDAQYCLDAYFAEIDSRFPGGFDREAGAAAAVEDFVSPNGCLLLVRLEGKPVGCGALRTFEAGIGEIKRMWVSPQARGFGVGRKLLEALERCAQALGFLSVRLDTNASLSEALRLYRSAGYREIDRFNDNPYAQHWFEKTLA
jgi:GNAT superfamily N-acetyltransferase